VAILSVHTLGGAIVKVPILAGYWRIAGASLEPAVGMTMILNDGRHPSSALASALAGGARRWTMSEEVITSTTTTPGVSATVDKFLPSRPRISWGAVIGGAISALGLWLLLYAFGLAVGLSSVDPNNPSSLKGSGIFTGVWSAVSPLVALFIGGVVAGRLSGGFNRGVGGLHGLVMWGLVSVGGAFFVMALVSTTVTGAAAVATGVAKGGTAAIRGLAGGGMGAASELGLDWNDALGPINQRLLDEGKPTVSADEMQAAGKSAIQNAMRTGRFDRTIFENALAQNTALSQSDARELGQRVESQINDLSMRIRARAHNAAETARRDALLAADKTGKAFFGVFGALFLGLVAALVGGSLGVPRVYSGDRFAHHRTRTTTVERRTRPLGPPVEAYPRG
jgi:hypothetical protein